MDMYIIISTIDQLNTAVHATMKTTPFELVFGQPPRNNIFPGAMGPVMEEDIAELLDEGWYLVYVVLVLF